MRRALVLIALALALVLGATPAAADDREEARRAFSAGQAADKAQRYREAIEHYLRAYELVPHQFAAYNIGADYERLGELREAKIWFDRYLERAPQSPDRDAVMKLLVELRLRPATLTVNSRPSGAIVYIDGQAVGVTPYVKPIRGGGHRIAVELAGQRDERDVVLEFAEPKTIQFTLRNVPRTTAPGEVPVSTVTAPGVSGPTGVLEVLGQPAGATIAIDGTVVARVPARIAVAPGEHTVTVSRFGFTPYETVATVVADGVTAVDPQLTRGGDYGGKPTVRLYYVVGAAGGADLRGEGSLYTAEFGIRARTYDLVTRVGRGLDVTSLEFMVRAGYDLGRLVPFFSIGYSVLGSGIALGLGAGVRFDVTRTDRFGISLVGEATVRKFSVPVEDPMTMVTTTKEGTAIPIMLSLQIMMSK